MRRLGSVLILAAVCGACGPSKRPPNPAVTAVDVSTPKGRGHHLVVLAAGCWMNGLWADALGVKPEARERSTAERCKMLLRAAERPPEDEDALRLLDPRLTDAVERAVWRTALADAEDARTARELVGLLDGIAAASREMLEAHRLVDGLYAMPPEQRRDRATTAGTAQGLRVVDAVRVLLRTGGPFAAEAHALGLLFALDRMDLARDLPNALKLDALAGVFLEIFRVAAPKPDHTDEQWVAYLTEVARAAGHPARATSSREAAEALAWDGILAGFADRLRATNAPGQIGDAARGAADRVDAAHVR